MENSINAGRRQGAPHAMGNWEESMKASAVWTHAPASWPGELWRESLPLGNGCTAALLCGSAGCEHLWIQRFDRWEGGEEGELPDVHDTLGEARALIAQGQCARANGLLAGALAARGYAPRLATPMAPLEIRIRMETSAPFSQYARGVDLDTGEAFVTFTQGEARVERRCFVSRAEDLVLLRMRAEGGTLSGRIDLPEGEELRIRVFLPAGGLLRAEGACCWRFEAAEELLLVAKFGEIPPEAPRYEELLAQHIPLHRMAMGNAQLTLGNEGRATDDLLAEAARDAAPVELAEKLWRFGRYLFASGTAEGGYPFALYGLWNGVAHAPWAQNVANENVQMIYWHALAGGFEALLRPLIDYYYRKMDAFREAARKLFGCRGIFVSVYTTPENSLPAPNVPVIVNYTGAAGWLCRHFYAYYQYTGDRALMQEKILPFMLETAAFYEDYLTRDARGRIQIVPSVSPENTPANFMPADFQEHMGHQNPVVWNSTMDFAIVRELLTHLVEASRDFVLDEARVAAWQGILRDMPPYMVNEDGALREWMDADLKDFYLHRHLSHLYPLFPGDEIRPSDPLFEACARAVQLRKLDGLSGWSFSHMAAIYARLGQAEAAIACLDGLAKGCLLSNLFTLHNDWRDMGVTLRISMAPVQLDALMGAVNAIQEMLLFAVPGEIRLLPACPLRFAQGSVENWRVPEGIICFAWNRAEGWLRASLTARADCALTLRFPAWSGLAAREIRLRANETWNL